MNFKKHINYSAPWGNWSWLTLSQWWVSDTVESVISDSNKLLEESLARSEWKWRRQLQKLRFANFSEVDAPIAEKAGFKRYRWNGKIAVNRLWENGQLILWWDKYLVDEIDAAYLENWDPSIECVNFIVFNEGKYYLYKHEWNWKVTLIPSFNSEDWAFFTKEAIEAEAEEILVWKWLEQQAEFQNKKSRLIELGYQPIQKQAITELTHYIKKLPSWKIYEILVDEYHENIVTFWGKTVQDGIKVYSSLTREDTRIMQWILVSNAGRMYFYIFWEQYRSTKKPLIRYNPNSDDGWFSSEEEFFEVLRDGKLISRTVN